MNRWPVHLYAVLSADDCIADAEGNMPKALMNDADWHYFQAELDTCALVVLASRSHLAAPNTAGRKRVVMTTQAHGVERRTDAYWWNPADISPGELFGELAPEGGKIGVPGGQAAFDYFLGYRIDAFHLTRAPRVELPGGRKVFSLPGPAEAHLHAAGLLPGAAVLLDHETQMSLTLWQRKPGSRP